MSSLVIESSHFEPVAATLAEAQLDPSRTIIHGGAVLAAYGLRPAGDLDCWIEPDYI